MKKRRRNNNELNEGSAVAVGGDDNDRLDEDIDMSSIMGCRARSSVPDADSTVGLGRDRLVNMTVGTGEERSGGDPAVMEADDDDDHDVRTVQSRWRFFRWFTRVSRSASSLLNQHSPNLNELLDATVDDPLDSAPRPPDRSSSARREAGRAASPGLSPHCSGGGPASR